MVLACSRLMFVRPVIRLDQTSWCDSHVEAFRFFGGTPARLVPDNLKTGVDRPDLYDPRINRTYAELATHYGVIADPARAFKPKDKPKVERAMPYVRDSFWRGRTGSSCPPCCGATRSSCGATSCRRRRPNKQWFTPSRMLRTGRSAIHPQPRASTSNESPSVPDACRHGCRSSVSPPHRASLEPGRRDRTLVCHLR